MKKSFLLILLFAFETQAQWQPDVRLTNDSNISLLSLCNARCIASSGEMVHVVWYDFRHSGSEIYYKRSTNGGETWGVDIRLTNDPFESRSPSITVSGSVIHVIWVDYRYANDAEIYYKHSSDGV